jgi:hypothetical protein
MLDKHKVYDVTGCQQVHIPAEARYFSLLKDTQISSGAYQPPLQWVMRFFPAKSDWG